MKKYNAWFLPLVAVLCGVGLPCRAANALPRVPVEISAGVIASDLQVNDRSGEKMVSRENGFTARGLVYPLRWLGVGVEGVHFGREDFFGNSYQDKRYGLLTKWVLTPDTTPSLYVLLGLGQHKQHVSYQGLWTSSSAVRYTQLGLGVDIPLYRYLFVGLEGQIVYHAHQKVDNLLLLNRRTERIFSLHIGLRF